MFEQTFKNIDDILRKGGMRNGVGLRGTDFLDSLFEISRRVGGRNRQNRALLTGEDYNPFYNEPYRWSN
jgi:type I restriction enzyme M protein